MSGELVYVAGPISGDPFGCVRQATTAWKHLRDEGLVPLLPQLSVLHEMVAPQPYEAWMAFDFDLIRNVDAVVRLPGASPGADREVELAESLGLVVAVFDLDPSKWAKQARGVAVDVEMARVRRANR